MYGVEQGANSYAALHFGPKILHFTINHPILSILYQCFWTEAKTQLYKCKAGYWDIVQLVEVLNWICEWLHPRHFGSFFQKINNYMCSIVMKKPSS